MTISSCDFLNYVVAIPIDTSLADTFGKRSSENGLLFYSRKINDTDAIIGLAPEEVAEKFHTVCEAILLSDQVLLSTNVVDKIFGEVLVACALSGKRILITDDNDVSQFTKAAGMENYEKVSREELIQKIISEKPSNSSGDTRVDIDRCFPVKGIGTVALGLVTHGKVTAKSSLFHTSGKKVFVRSIQSHDVDINEADRGTRVGLALKDIESDELERGDILTSQAVGEVRSIVAKIHMSPAAKEKIEKGSRYALVSNFNYLFAIVEEASGEKITLKLDTTAPILKGDKFFLMREKTPRIFAIGEAL